MFNDFQLACPPSVLLFLSSFTLSQWRISLPSSTSRKWVQRHNLKKNLQTTLSSSGQHKLKFNRHFEALKNTVKSGSESHAHTCLHMQQQNYNLQSKLDLNLIFPLLSHWTSVLGLHVDVLASGKSMLEQIIPFVIHGRLHAAANSSWTTATHRKDPHWNCYRLTTGPIPQFPCTPWSGWGREVSNERVKLSLEKRRWEILL